MQVHKTRKAKAPLVEIFSHFRIICSFEQMYESTHIQHSLSDSCRVSLTIVYLMRLCTTPALNAHARACAHKNTHYSIHTIFSNTPKYTHVLAQTHTNTHTQFTNTQTHNKKNRSEANRRTPCNHTKTLKKTHKNTQTHKGIH